jgi:hypothetical protein
VLGGWAGSEALEEAFHTSTRQFCPSIHYRAVDGRPPDTRFSLWSVADIFLSLSDNIQETFGLTPIEAMAAGLPCVVSDWDGYRDTVRHGIDGFRVPTCAPRGGLGEDLAYAFAQEWMNYDQYVAGASQLIAVDINRAAEALTALVLDANLRRRMGAAGAQRAREVFDWSAIIPQYQDLWGELAARRACAPEPGPNHLAGNPARLDPFRLFASYPTAPLSGSTVLTAVAGLSWADAAQRLNMRLAVNSPWARATTAEIEAAFARLSVRGEATVDDLLAEVPAERRVFVERSLLWLAKFAVVLIRPDREVEA